MKTYSHAPDADSCIEKIQAEHHDELRDVTVSALFVFDHETSLPVLKHQGYPAGAVARITPLKDRALGIADATIVIDRAGWLTLSQGQRDALVDHELTHLTRKVDKETGEFTFDVLDRPVLTMRKHDRQFGWFDEVAQRHGEASPEVRQAQRLVQTSGQLYFDFGPATGGALSRFEGKSGEGTLKDGTPFTITVEPVKDKPKAPGRKPRADRHVN